MPPLMCATALAMVMALDAAAADPPAVDPHAEAPNAPIVHYSDLGAVDAKINGRAHPQSSPQRYVAKARSVRPAKMAKAGRRHADPADQPAPPVEPPKLRPAFAARDTPAISR